MLYPNSIDTEDSLYRASNNASTTLSADLMVVGSTIEVTDSSVFPNGRFILSIEDELIIVDSKNDSLNQLYAEQRGAFGTVAASHISARKASLNVLAQHHEVLRDSIIAIQDQTFSFKKPVKSVENDPPLTPSNGDRYIVGSVPTGAFETHANSIAEWDGTVWNFYVPETGWIAHNLGLGYNVTFNGSQWSYAAPEESVQSVAGKTGIVVLGKSDVGLSNVDNTSDLDKPVSTATQNALDNKLDSNDASVTNAREWTAETVSQLEAETGTATTRRAWTAERVRQGVVGWWNTITSIILRNPTSRITVSRGTGETDPGTATLLHTVNVGFGNRTTADAFLDGPTGSPNYISRRARGTEAAPSAVMTGDVLSNMASMGYGATKWPNVAPARIIAKAAENFTDTANGVTLEFLICPIGSVSSGVVPSFVMSSNQFYPDSTNTTASLGLSTARWNQLHTTNASIYGDITIVPNAGLGKVLVSNETGVGTWQTFNKIDSSEKGVANGVATLDATTLVPRVQLGTGTADNAHYLRGDGTWAVPTSGGGLGSLTFFNSNGSQDDIDLIAATSLESISVQSEFDMAANADFRVGGQFGWRDLFGPIESRGGASAPNWALFRDGIYAYSFANNSTREAFINFHIDHDYAMGTPMYPHVHISTNTTTSGTVRFGIEYTVAKGHQQATGSIFGPTTTVFVTATINGATDQYKHFVLEVGDANAIPSTNLEPDSMILMRVFRDNTVAGNLAQPVFVFQADLHYRTARFATPNKAPNFYGV